MKEAPKFRQYQKPNLIQELYMGTTEKSFQESAFNADSLNKPFNNDDLYNKTGDLSRYEEMLKDDQVYIASQLKKEVILGEYDIITEDEADEEVRADVECALNEDPEIPLMDSLQEILSAQDFGYSISEKVFKRRPDGSLTLKFIKTRHPDTWLVHTDNRGNVEKYEQRAVDKDVKINPKSLIHLVNNRKFGNPYGTSDLRPAYAAWFTKRQIMGYYGIFLEKNASPTPVARYDVDAPNEAVTAIHNAIKSFQTKTAITIPKQIEVDFIESQSKGEAYSMAINIMNMMIGRALFVPDLLGFSGSETQGGSFALGEHHLGMFYKHIERRQKAIEDIVNQHIVRPIVVANHGFMENFPKFKFRSLVEENTTEKLKTWIDAMRLKIWEPTDEEINYFRAQVDFPEGEIERKEPAPNPFKPGGSVSSGKPDAGNNDRSDSSPAVEIEDNKASNKETFAKRVFDMPEGDFAKRVDFAVLERQMISNEESLLAELMPIVDTSFDRLFDSIEKKKIIQNGNFQRIDSIKMTNLAKMKSAIKGSFRRAFVDAKRGAQAELFAKKFGEPLASDQFLEFLDKETFRFIGDWEFEVTKGASVAMRNAIKDGKPLSSVIDIIDTETKKKSLVSLERYARTKFTEVMNRGRTEFFEESGVVAAFQYSAILDGRTTDICNGLHGKIFKRGNQPIPPLHFNCRSLTIPITQFEKFKVDTKAKNGQPIGTFIDKQLEGTKFSKR